jgi:hypothetical protein
VPTVQEHAAGGDQGAVSRIYETRGGPDSLRWFWSMTVNGPMARSDRVATLEEAKAQFSEELGRMEDVGESGGDAVGSGNGRECHVRYGGG